MEQVTVMRVYAIRDKVAKEFGPLALSKNDSVAWRSFEEYLASLQGKDPNDYSLFWLGEYCLETGAISSLEKPRKITAEDYVIGEDGLDD